MASKIKRARFRAASCFALWVIGLGCSSGKTEYGLGESNVASVVGLTTFVPFDEGSGDVAHDQAGFGDVQLLEGVDWMERDGGHAVRLDGKNGEVVLNPMDFSNRDFTVALFVHPHTHRSYAGIFNNRDPAKRNLGFQIRLAADDGLVEARIDFGEKKRWVRAPLPIGSWHHVAVTVKRAKDMVLYIDGTESNRVDVSRYRSTRITNTDVARLGVIESRRYHFDGALDELRVYDRALAPEEVDVLSKDGGATPPPPVACVPDCPEERCGLNDGCGGQCASCPSGVPPADPCAFSQVHFLGTDRQVSGEIRWVPGGYSSIREAVLAAREGDLVVLEDGVYQESGIVIDKAITIASRALLDEDLSHRKETVVDGGSSEFIFQTEPGMNAVEFVGLTFRGSRKSIVANNEVAVYYSEFHDASDQLSFERHGFGRAMCNRFESASDDGIDVDSAPDGEAYIEISHNTIQQSGDDGIEIRFYERDSGSPIMPYEIRGNTIRGADEDGVQLIDERASSNDNSRIVHIMGNLIVGSRDAGVGCMAEQNTIENFEGAPDMMEPVYVVGNTIVGGRYGVSGGGHTVVLNSIVADHSEAGVHRVGKEGWVDYTLFFNNAQDHLSEVLASGTHNFFNQEPGYDRETYRLVPGAFSIDKGTSSFERGSLVFDSPLQSFTGEAPDLGAFEFESGSTGDSDASLIVDAGEDRVVIHPEATLTLEGRADSHRPVVLKWHQIDGPGEARFGSPTSLTTNVEFPAMGIYELELAADNGANASADRIIVRYIKDGNGADQIFEEPLFMEAEAFAYLYGTARVVADGDEKAVEAPIGQGHYAFADYHLVTTDRETDLTFWIRAKSMGSEPARIGVSFHGSQTSHGSLLVPASESYRWLKMEGTLVTEAGHWRLTVRAQDDGVRWDRMALSVDAAFDPNGGSEPPPPPPTAQDCFSGLTTDTKTYFDPPTSSLPGYLEPFVDPVFGTRAIRVSNPGEEIPNVGGIWGEVARHHYSKNQAWNADQSLLMLDRGTSGNLYLDGSTYQPVFLKKAPGRNRWHPIEPDLQVFVRDDRIGVWNVRTSEIVSVATFDGYSGFTFGKSEGNLSHDGNRLVVSGTNPAGQFVAFGYDLNLKRKYPDIRLKKDGFGTVSVSPLGGYVVVHGDDLDSVGGADDQSQVYDLEGRKVGPLWSRYHRPGHYDLAVDENGDEVAVGVSKADPDKGRVLKRRLVDGKVTVLTDGGYASHTSTRNTARPGWAYVTYKGPREAPWLPYSDEIIAVKLDGSMETVRIVQTNSAQNGYLTEQHGSVSPDGTKVIWASNWGDPEGHVASYVVDLCER